MSRGRIRWYLVLALGWLLSGCRRETVIGTVEVEFRGAEGAVLTLRPFDGEPVVREARFDAEASRRPKDEAAEMKSQMGVAIYYSIGDPPRLGFEQCWFLLDFHELAGSLEGQEDDVVPLLTYERTGRRAGMVFWCRPLEEHFTPISSWPTPFSYRLRIPTGELRIERMDGRAIVGHLKADLVLYRTIWG